MERGRQSQKSYRGPPPPQQRSPRNSQRSKSSTSSGDPKERIKNCCRKVVEFMCTQVGVGGLVVGYAIIGAIAFVEIEKAHVLPLPIYKEMNKTRNLLLDDLWVIALNCNNLYEERFKTKVNHLLSLYQDDVFIAADKKSYDPCIEGDQERWNFSVALMFTLSVFTMIGYGKFVPVTDTGKIVTILYAIVGIPMYWLYLNSMGRVLAGTFRWLYIKLYLCNLKKKDVLNEDDEAEKVLVPSTACLWVMALYIAAGTALFSFWEKWSIVDSVYFCITSLCKIGMGDLVPGAARGVGSDDTNFKLVMNFIFLLLGMGLISMCYILMKEEIHVKLKEIKTNVKTKASTVADRFGLSHYNDNGYYERSYPQRYYRQQS